MQKQNLALNNLQWLICHKNPINQPSGATSLGQNGPGSNGNERVLCISRTSPLDCLVSYPGHLLEVVLPLYRDAFSVFYNPSLVGCSC